MHKGFLLQKIPHFVKSLGPDAQFKEGLTNTVDLPGMTDRAFNVMLNWIYKDFLPDIPWPLPVKGKIYSSSEHQALLKIAQDAEEKYHEIIYDAEIWLCAPLAKIAFEVIRKGHRAMGDRPMFRKSAFDSIINLETSSGFRKFLLRCVCVHFMDLDDSHRSVFFDALADNNANDKDLLRDDLFKTMADMARQKVKPTIKMLLESKEDWYADSLIVRGSGKHEVSFCD